MTSSPTAEQLIAGTRAHSAEIAGFKSAIDALFLQFSEEAPKRSIDGGSFSTSQDVGHVPHGFKSISDEKCVFSMCSPAAGYSSASSLKLGPNHGEQLHGFGPSLSGPEKWKIKALAIAVGLTPFAVGGLLACIVI